MINLWLKEAKYDPVTGETYWRGRWWQPEEQREMLQAMEQYEAEKEDYEERKGGKK